MAGDPIFRKQNPPKDANAASVRSAVGAPTHSTKRNVNRHPVLAPKRSAKYNLLIDPGNRLKRSDVTNPPKKNGMEQMIKMTHRITNAWPERLRSD